MRKGVRHRRRRAARRPHASSQNRVHSGAARLPRSHPGRIAFRPPLAAQTALGIAASSPRPTASVLHASCGLLGVALGLLGGTFPALVEGIVASVDAPSSPLPLQTAVWSAMLAALAVGIRLPHKIAVLSLKRLAGSPPILSTGRTLTGPERMLALLVLSIIALACGVLVIILPVWNDIVAGVYRLLSDQFVWSNVSLAVLCSAIAFLVCMGPCLLIGFAVACADRLSRGGWNSFPAVGVFTGAAVGIGLVETCLAAGAQLGLLQKAVALPVLAVAVATALAATTDWPFSGRPLRAEPSTTTGATESANRPADIDGSRRLPRAIVIVGVVSIVAPMSIAHASSVRPGRVAVCFLVSLSAGAAVGLLLRRFRWGQGPCPSMVGPSALSRSGPNRFAVAMCLAGMATAIAGLLITVAGQASVYAAAILIALICGSAGVVGWEAIEAGSSRQHRSRLVSQTLLGGAAGLLVAPIATEWSSTPALLGLMSLALIGGGLMLGVGDMIPSARSVLGSFEFPSWTKKILARLP